MELQKEIEKQWEMTRNKQWIENRQFKMCQKSSFYWKSSMGRSIGSLNFGHFYKWNELYKNTAQHQNSKKTILQAVLAKTIPILYSRIKSIQFTSQLGRILAQFFFVKRKKKFTSKLKIQYKANALWITRKHTTKHLIEWIWKQSHC